MEKVSQTPIRSTTQVIWIVIVVCILDDNIQDPTLNVSSSRRVQVQYRLRVHQIFNYAVSQNIFGFEHFSLQLQVQSSSSPITLFLQTHRRHRTLVLRCWHRVGFRGSRYGGWLYLCDPCCFCLSKKQACEWYRRISTARQI